MFKLMQETFDLVPVDEPNDKAFSVLAAGIRKCSNLVELKRWWGRNNNMITGLPGEHRSRIVKIKDELKARLR
jgi:hypothetical protein